MIAMEALKGWFLRVATEARSYLYSSIYNRSIKKILRATVAIPLHAPSASVVIKNFRRGIHRFARIVTGTI